MLLSWGPDCIALYNDACIAILGAKHPNALGLPLREFWSEICDIFQGLLDERLRGEAHTWSKDTTEIRRAGQAKETHWSGAYTIVPDETAPKGIGGVLATWRDITAQVEAQRALAAARSEVDKTQRDSEAHETLRAALRRAEANERMLAALMAHVPEGITLCDADGTLQMVSQYGQDLLGAPHAGKSIEEVSRKWSIYVADGQTEFSTEELPLRRALRGEVARDVELVQVDDEGRKWPLLCNAAPIRDANGEVVGGVVAWRDISELKRAQEALLASEKRYRDLFNAMIEGFALHEIICDAQGKPIDYRFLEFNAAFEQLTGLHRDIIGKTHNEVLPNDDSKWVETYGRVAITGEPIRFENYSPALGRHYEVAAFCSAPRQFATVFNDITERKLAEEKLRDADRRKNEFIGMLSHELRNPLTPVRNCLHILEHVEPGDPRARKSLDIIRRQVDQLIRLVEDLLDVTRVARGKIQLRKQSIELGALLSRTCEDHASEFTQAQIHFETNLIQGCTTVIADPTRVAQLVGNLLQNAAKFTPAGGRVCVSLDREEHRNQAVIRVSDTGAGIAPAALEQLFEPFTQAETTLDRSNGGLGLGLSLVKALTQLHGGSVEAQSQGLGTGAEFIVRLPLETQEVAS
jgi:PAS domain S-box-containing protein